MTASNNFLTDLYYLAREKGLDADGILALAGVEKDVVDAPSARVETGKLALVVRSIWDGLQDEAMGLSESQIPRGAFFMMGKAAIAEPTLRKALLTGIRFYSMVTKAFRMELKEEGNYARLVFHMLSPEIDDRHLFAEVNLMAWHRFASWLISENLLLHGIYFDYASPGHTSEYAYLFPGQHRFGADFQGFSFHRNFLDREISQTPGALKRFIQRCPEDLFKQPRTDFSVSSELKKLLKKTLSDRMPVIEEAACSLNMTKRTLIRKLQDEGTSYQQLKDLVRRDRAIRLLGSRGLTLTSIAESVGFSDPAVFARAFKGWTGVAPSDYRRGLTRSP
ncbi:AraC family transcriptional regulator [Kordiimonas marina]|uniref:AraC family transcriptional regulator n=1 Tax=Kordiimonas marina TaxID=2872312 RepID=UPI001FF2992F|nr:AraC family transcriptional regulator [Kordiimonas marina]MCJ9427790.1 AraC family transcriptional regulator [Kordiimonas marina]